MTLFRQHAKSEAVSTLVWAICVGLFGFFTTYMFEMMVTSGSLSDMEKMLGNATGVVKMFIGGPVGLSGIMGWLAGFAMGGWTSFVYMIFVAMFVVGMITREMDRRTMEFVLSLPVSRANLLLSRYAVLVCSLVAMLLAHFLGVWGTAAALGYDVPAGRLAMVELNGFLLYLCMGSLMLLVSLFLDDYGAGTSAMLGIGLGLDVLYMVTGESAGAMKSLHDVLPFAFFDSQSILLKGTVPWGDMTILAVGAGLFLALSIWVFQRKQIAV
ncbi:MAG TPA: ABC transporter permease [Candidatus Sulfotelmatobacter sp.]|nr:ABC transporter permease [Candidatus Sulfotelmatobacter sp.]